MSFCSCTALHYPKLQKKSRHSLAYCQAEVEERLKWSRHESVPHRCGIGGVVQQQNKLREENLYCLAWGNLGRYIPPLGLIVVGPTATRPLSVNVIGSIREKPGTSSSSFSSSSSPYLIPDSFCLNLAQKMNVDFGRLGLSALNSFPLLS